MKQNILGRGGRLVALLMTCVIVMGVLLSGGSVANADSKLTDATVQKYEEQIADLQKQQKAIQNNLAKMAKEGSSLAAQKQAVDTYMDTTQRKIEIAQILLDELEVKINDNIASLEDAEAEYNRMYEQFWNIVVMNYEEGDASYIGLILGADSLSDFLTRMDHVSSLLAYNKSIMDTLQQTQSMLEEDKLSLETKIALQNETLMALGKDIEDLAKQEEDILGRIKDLEKDQAAAQKEYYENKKQEDQLDKELEEYLAELQRKNQEKMESGDWLWPISLNDYQRCSSGFGWRKLYGVWDYHRGWDLAAYRGTPIYASKGGKVVIAQYHNSYGNYIVIDHGNGLSTLYAHNTKNLVKVGDVVDRGQQIATCGSSGDSTGNHLHFSVRVDGSPVNPMNYISN